MQRPADPCRQHLELDTCLDQMFLSPSLKYQSQSHSLLLVARSALAFSRPLRSPV